MVYDSRNRGAAMTLPHKDEATSVWRLMHDAESNVTAVTDPAGNVDVMSYDAINRLSASTHRLNGNSSYEYDKLNRLAKYTAPTGVVTSYEYDGLGRLVAEHSPDRGTTTYSYDLSDNMVRMVTARGITETYGYDELDRPVSVSYPNTTAGKDENVTLSYDNCAFGKGLLCKVEDESGTAEFSYDAFGNVVSQKRTELGVSYTTSYAWDREDMLMQITLPRGRVVDYSKDSIRRLQGISATVNGTKQNVVSDISYRADGLMLGCTYGNGLTDSRAYDLQGRLTSQSLKSANSTVDQRSYGYDVKSNITSISVNGNARSYGYDALDRLMQELYQPDDESSSYGINLNHNRQTGVEQPGGARESYGYLDGSNRLLRTSAVNQQQLLPTPKPDELYEYNDAGRLWRYHEGGKLAAEYIYDAFGQRTRKTLYNEEGAATGTTIYHWSMGVMVTETTATGGLIRDYIHGESLMPVAQVDAQQSAQGETSEQISYLHEDHLQTPRLATSATGSVVWRWDGDGFGDAIATGSTEINIRFPGQYHDAESGLHYNLYRYYDPATGRYLRSDPIGLQAGTNTYVYAGHNPIGSYDPEGLILPAGAAGAALVAAGRMLIRKAPAIGRAIGMEARKLSKRLASGISLAKGASEKGDHDAYKDVCDKAGKMPEKTCGQIARKTRALLRCGNMRVDWLYNWKDGKSYDKDSSKGIKNHWSAVSVVIKEIRRLILKMRRCGCSEGNMYRKLKDLKEKLLGIDHQGNQKYPELPKLP